MKNLTREEQAAVKKVREVSTLVDRVFELLVEHNERASIDDVSGEAAAMEINAALIAGAIESMSESELIYVGKRLK